MGQEVVNKNKNCVFNGPYAGRDLYITMYQDNEREFVVTHTANIKPVSYFTGRETELQELRQRIEDGRKSVLVSGMGGIGKTHICRKLFEEYLNKHADDENGPFRHIGYVEYSGEIGSSLQSCLKYKEQDAPEKNQEAAWRELEYLAADGKLLLFVDNVDRPINADLGLQRLKSIPGAIVLTSRQASFGDEFAPYRIGFLGMEQCKEIYEKIRFESSGGKIKLEEVQDLEYVIENLAGRHTITVELLAHLARTKTWPVRKLREKLEEKGFCLEFHKDGELINIQESYEALYDLSELTGAEQNILEAFSVFPYISLAAETCNEWLLTDAGVSEDDDILMGLYERGWLQFDIEQESYALHPVFAQFIYEKYKPKLEMHSGLIKACRKCLVIPESGSALECKKFIPFAENIIELMGMVKSEKQIEFIDTFANLLRYLGEYRKAEKLYKKILEICNNDWEEDPLGMTYIYNDLACTYEMQGEYEKAKELHEKNVQIRKDMLGEVHQDTAASYCGIAAIYMRQKELEKAEALYEKSLLIYKSALGENNQNIARVYSNLASICADQGVYAKAEELYKKSLKISKKILGESHPFIATCYNNLGGVYDRQGKHEKAKEMFEKSLWISENMLGKNHPDTAIRYNNLAGVYLRQGEYKKAEKLYKSNLQIYKGMLGDNHPFTAKSYNNLAYVYENQGKYNKALIYYLRAYKILIFKLGLNHPDVRTVYRNMEILYSQRNIESNFEQWIQEELKEEKKNTFRVIKNDTIIN